MKRTVHLFGLAILTAVLAACQTSHRASSTTVPQVALATSQYREVFNLDRPVVTEFAASDEIAISVHIPRGCGYGEREGTLLVRNLANGRIIRREKQMMKEEDYVAFKQAKWAVTGVRLMPAPSASVEH